MERMREAHLKANAITSNCDDVIIPHESGNGFTLNKTGVLMLMSLSGCTVVLLLVEIDGLPGLGKATAEEKDVAWFEIDLAILGDFQHFFEGNCVAVHSVDFHA